MELTQFLTSKVTVQAVTDLIDSRPNAIDLGYVGAEYMPEVYQDVTEFKRSVARLMPSIIARDVAPNATGRFGMALKRQQVGGNLIDSAAHLHYDGEEFEMFLSLVRGIQGDQVRANMPAVMNYLQIVDRQLLVPLDMNKERKRLTLMGTGKAFYEAHRQDLLTLEPALNVYDASQITVVTQASGKSIYGGASADFIADIRAAVEDAKKDGYEIAEILCHSLSEQTVLGLTSTREALGAQTLYVETGGQLNVKMNAGTVDSTQLNAYLRSQKLPQIRTYDGYFRDMVHAEGDPVGTPGTYVTQSYIPEGRFILVPDGTTMPELIPEDVRGPQAILTPVDPRRRVGVHIIGRPTGQSRGPRTYVFGPYYHEGIDPNMDGDSTVAHMPFNLMPGGFRVIEYQKP